MAKKNKLEDMIEAKSKHQCKCDRLELIHNHVLVVVFVAIIFLFSAFMFTLSTPIEPSVTGNSVLIDYSDIVPNLHIGEVVGDFFDSIRDSDNRSFIALTFYTFWIIVFIVINGAMLERQRKK